MKLSTGLFALAVGGELASAFYIYHPPSKAVEKPTFGNYVSHGFAFTGPEGATDRTPGLSRMNIKKIGSVSSTSLFDITPKTNASASTEGRWPRYSYF
jgi:hypothetical protein